MSNFVYNKLDNNIQNYNQNFISLSYQNFCALFCCEEYLTIDEKN